MSHSSTDPDSSSASDSPPILHSRSASKSSSTFDAPAPSNPRASREARQLLAFLQSIAGRYTLSGQHNYIPSGRDFTDLVELETGQAPLVWGSDFSFAYRGDEPARFQHCGPLNLTVPGQECDYTELTPEAARSRLVEEAIRQYERGHIITLMWHMGPPWVGDVCDGHDLWAMERRPGSAQWQELVTRGTPLNDSLRRRAAEIAGYLRQLQEARVPVLWRPWHEMNGVWFWWCRQAGPMGFTLLWRALWEFFTIEKGLDNLLWVWNPNAPRDRPGDEAFAYTDYWPGGETVDALAADVYRKDWRQSHHDDLLALAAGRPIALGEVGEPPSRELLEKQSSWTWFMTWGDLIRRGEGFAILRDLWSAPRVLALGDVTRNESGVYEVTKR